jgi:hypothetical protein
MLRAKSPIDRFIAPSFNQLVHLSLKLVGMFLVYFISLFNA